MLLLQPFGSKQSIPFVRLIHLFVGRCSLVVKDLHEHFSADAHILWSLRKLNRCVQQKIWDIVPILWMWDVHIK